MVIGMHRGPGPGGQFSLGHAGLFAMGAYTSALVSKKLEAVAVLGSAGLHIWIGMLAGIVMASVFGAVLAYPALRVKGPYLAMVTVAFGWVIWKVLLEWVSVTGGELGITSIPKARFGSFVLETARFYYVVMAFAIGALLLQRNPVESTFGRKMQAIKFSEMAAASVGIDVYRSKVTIFILSAAFAGLGGALFAHQQNFINPDNFKFFDSVFFLLAILFGGAGTLFGPVVGAATLTFLPEVLHGFDHYRLIVYGMIILLTLYFLPRGVCGVLLGAGSGQSAAPLSPERRAAPVASIVSAAARRRDQPLLEVGGVSKAFGGLRALDQVSLSVAPATVHALIGPNGAGKTTLLNAISGVYASDSGEIRLGGRSRPPEVARPGGAGRHRPHLSDREALRRHERARGSRVDAARRVGVPGVAVRTRPLCRRPPNPVMLSWSDSPSPISPRQNSGRRSSCLRTGTI
jgi:ABC-type branched-subunit amino acid transport system permease subunit